MMRAGVSWITASGRRPGVRRGSTGGAMIISAQKQDNEKRLLQARRTFATNNNATFDAIIVGGGVAGVNCAHAFAKRGQKTLLLEQNSLTSGSTWHAAGLVTHFKGSPLIAELAEAGGKVYKEMEEIGWHNTGSLAISRSPETAENLLQACQQGWYQGHTHHLLESLEQAQKVHPFLHNPRGDFQLAVHSPHDGIVNPADCTMAVAKRARQVGAVIQENARVVGFGLDQDRTKVLSVQFVSAKNNGAAEGHLHEDDVQTINLADRGNVVIAASAWTRGLTKEFLGEGLPLGYAPHQYTIFNTIKGVTNELPVVRDFDGRYYCKPEVGGFMIGVFEAQPIPHIPDFVLERSVTAQVPSTASHEVFEESLDKAEQGGEFSAALEAFPVLQETEIKQWLHGPDTHTPDHGFLLGPLVGLDNCFSAGGFNSQGIQTGPAVGQALAEWALDGYPHSFQNHFEDCKVARFNPEICAKDEWVAYRALESYGGTYLPHLPREADESVRGLALKSPFYDLLKADGGVFSEAFGWERAMYFDRGETRAETEWTEMTPHKSAAVSVAREHLSFEYKKSKWFEFEKREALHCRNECVAFDMTPFGKIRVKGENARALMQYAVFADLDNAEKGRDKVGSVVYTGFANEMGGLLGDLTVCRISDTEFYCVVPAADPFEFLRHLRHCQKSDDSLVKDVQITHETNEIATLAVMGPKSRLIFEKAYPGTDFSDEKFPANTFQIVEPGVRALRVSFAGTLGWELHMENAKAAAVYKTMFDTAKEVDVDLRNAGMFSLLNSLRMEKAFLHNGHDADPLVTPMEAGLTFAMDWNKPFRGSEKLKERKKQGMRKRLCSFLFEDLDISPHGHYADILYRDGEPVGYLTSVGYSHTLDRPFGLGFVDLKDEAKKKPKKWLESGKYECSVIHRGKVVRTPIEKCVMGAVVA
ncbi:unnamed protein product [Amoebophrya sp. A120]|nr:unnamed protein product [Amoebophrya sp. A120]|eukprot:GSA120T00004365001.1